MMNEQSDIESVRLLDDPIEHLFSAVEFGLLQRMINRDLPEFLIACMDQGFPITDLVLFAWDVYHESDCAKNGKDRTVNRRVRAFVTREIGNAEIVSALFNIVQLINLEAIADYRPIREEEYKIRTLFEMLANHYKVKYGL